MYSVTAKQTRPVQHTKFIYLFNDAITVARSVIIGLLITKEVMLAESEVLHQYLHEENE
jgi:hypothetical protein